MILKNIYFISELAKKIGHVTENYGSFGKMIVDCGKVFSNNIGAYQKASDGYCNMQIMWILH